MKRDRRGWWRKPVIATVLVSLGIHLLLLLIFGGTVLFREGMGGSGFQAETVPMENRMEEDTPDPEETTHPEMANEEPPLGAAGMAPETVTVESVTKLSGESGWAPPVRGEGRVPLAGFSGKGAGRGKGKSELFGASVGDKRLGVIVDVSGSMQPYLPIVMTEVLRNFPNAEVVLVDGCGMEKAEVLSPPGARFRTAGRNRRVRREPGVIRLIPPHVVGFDSREGLASPAVGGAGYAGGLRRRYPQVYETLLHRSATWMVVGDGSEAAAQLALEHLAADHVQAIYWFSDFEDPVDPEVGERTVQCMQENKIDVYLHPIEGLKNIRNWAEKVGAEVIEVKL